MDNISHFIQNNPTAIGAAIFGGIYATYRLCVHIFVERPTKREQNKVIIDAVVRFEKAVEKMIEAMSTIKDKTEEISDE